MRTPLIRTQLICMKDDDQALFSEYSTFVLYVCMYISVLAAVNQCPQTNVFNKRFLVS
jgi:hypothetical protein